MGAPGEPMNPYEHFAREDDYPSLDVDGAS